MAKIIAFAGSKGGTGKSTLSHLAAHGAGSLTRPIPTVVVTTDPEDELVEGERRYVVVDGRSPDLLANQLERLLAIEKLLVVIDGVANRAYIDQILGELADLVVIPYGPSAQDGDRAAANLQAMPTAVGMPNRWPTHPGVAKRARRWLETVPASRRLPPLKSIPRLDSLLSRDSYAEIAYEVASPARGLILEILGRRRSIPTPSLQKRQSCWSNPFRKPTSSQYHKVTALEATVVCVLAEAASRVPPALIHASRRRLACR